MPTPTSINLRERYGCRYRATCEPSHEAEHRAGARVDEPWVQIIPCRFGHIFPHERQTPLTDHARKLSGVRGATILRPGTQVESAAESRSGHPRVFPSQKRAPATGGLFVNRGSWRIEEWILDHSCPAHNPPAAYGPQTRPLTQDRWPR